MGEQQPRDHQRRTHQSRREICQQCAEQTWQFVETHVRYDDV